MEPLNASIAAPLSLHSWSIDEVSIVVNSINLLILLESLKDR